MSCIIARATATFGATAVKAAIDYGARAAAGHTSVSVLRNIKNNIENSGAHVAGRVGQHVGSFLGRAVAGHAIPLAQAEGAAVASAVRILGHQAMEASHTHLEDHTYATPAQSDLQHAASPLPNSAPSNATEPEQASLGFKIFRAASAACAIGGGVALATGTMPVTAAGLAIAIAQSAPKIVQAATSRIKPKEKANINLMNDIVVPVMTATAIRSAGLVVQGVVQYDTVQTAFNSSIAKGEQIGRAAAWYLPTNVQNACGNLGRMIGYVDAGRYAMSDEVLQKASTDGLLCRNVTEMSLETLDTVINNAEQDSDGTSYWQVGKKVGLVAGGIIGGAVLVAVMPEAAAVAGGTALIGVADKAIRWVRVYASDENEVAPINVQPAATKTEAEVTTTTATTEPAAATATVTAATVVATNAS